MAEIHFSHDMGYVGARSPEPELALQDEPQAASRPNHLKMLTNLAGAVASIALVAGAATWSYKLIVRDVSGIPVVRAAEGDMRVRPDEPGGQLARNTGLAVNEVAAAGSAAQPADRLLLAPDPLDLADEDAPMVAATVPPVQQPVQPPIEAPAPVADSVPEASPVPPSEIDALVDQLLAGAQPIEISAEAEAGGPEVMTRVAARIPAAEAGPDSAPTAPRPAAVTGPGPKTSLRPQIRPGGTLDALGTPARTAPAGTAVRNGEIDPAGLPAGTRLVQLGAYDSAEIARQQWDRMQARFGPFLQDKDRVVQRAQSGGRTFYRLRAHGFADLSEARRFCSALVAEGADCIPVVTR